MAAPCRFAALSVFVLMAASVAAPQPSGLGALLDGVSPGMTFADFLKVRPGARYSDMDRVEEAPSPEQPGGLVCHWEKDPFMGLACLGDFGFRDGRLYEFVLMWTGPETGVAEAERRFFAACVEKHGKAFEREALRVNPGSENGATVPVLCWVEGDTRILAYYTAPAADTGRRTGAFTYAQFPKGDETVSGMLHGETLSPAELEELWKPMPPLLPK
ncbi:MAG: hypothetical protein GX580_15985 [Candidatus Hydrogenedens sp.]|nr:hypothetical protein [Candidatus Hydrogenedentota bacterium]NLF59129.1 hypothetical protein [Candidatus Hydrogenedens sp.]